MSWKAVEEARATVPAEKLRQQLAEIEEGINDVVTRSCRYVYVISRNIVLANVWLRSA